MASHDKKSRARSKAWAERPEDLRLSWAILSHIFPDNPFANEGLSGAAAVQRAFALGASPLARAEPPDDPRFKQGQPYFLSLAGHTAPDKLDQMRAFLDAGCPPSFANDHGFTALHQLAQTADSAQARACVELLLERGADLNAMGRFKTRPLDMAAQVLNTWFFERLASAGAVPGERSRFGTPPHRLADTPYADLESNAAKTRLVSRLIEMGVDASSKDEHGRNFLHSAEDNLDPWATDMRQRLPAIVEQLRLRPATPMAPPSDPKPLRV